MADVAHPNRHLPARIGLGPSLAALLATSACIATDRTLAPPDADTSAATEVAADDTEVSDVTATAETDVATDGADTAEAGCLTPSACPQPAPGTCRVATCVDGVCGTGNAGKDVACDDGDPCRFVDFCDEGVCKPGPSPAADQTSCSDGDACNGAEYCNALGECIYQGAAICTAAGTDLVCVDKQCVPKGMVVVADGTFLMGCDDETTPVDCRDDAMPQINVFLPAYAIDRTEVPERAFTACVDATQCTPRDANVKGPADPDRPAAPLRFGQAKELCTFLGRRLCRETEWEKAARGGVGARLYPWGDAEPTCSRANFKTTEGVPGGASSCSDDSDYPTVPVDAGADGASPYGALNMLGNVREWVADAYAEAIYATWYDDALRAHASAGTPFFWIDNPPAPPEGSGAPVVRGLGWRSPARDLRLDFRSSETADTVADDLGVRCCFDLAPLAVTSRP